MLIDRKKQATKSEKNTWHFKLKSIVASTIAFLFIAVLAVSFGQVEGCNSGPAKNSLAVVHGINIFRNNSLLRQNSDRLAKFYPNLKPKQRFMYALQYTVEHYLLYKTAEENKITPSRELLLSLLLKYLKDVKVEPAQFGAQPKSYRLSVENWLKNNYRKSMLNADLRTAARATGLQLQIEKMINSQQAAVTIVTADLNSATNAAAQKAIKDKIEKLYAATKDGKANFAVTAARMGFKAQQSGLFGFLQAPKKNPQLMILQDEAQFHTTAFSMKKGAVSPVMNLNGTLVIFQVTERKVIKDRYEKYIKDKKLFAKLPKKKQAELKKQEYLKINLAKRNNFNNIFADWKNAMGIKAGLSLNWKEINK